MDVLHSIHFYAKDLVCFLGSVNHISFLGGFDQSDKDLVLSVLSIAFEPGEDSAGQVLITLAGDGAIRVEVETLEVTLRDVTRPYRAPSGKRPSHPV